jgi:outer membrane receptor protein involved in Fe transport
LDLTLAGRVEHYEGVGTTSNPTVGLAWQPVADLHLRATYGTSFRAPALREELDPAIFVPSLLTLGSDRIRTLILDGGNPGLKPETAQTWTLGADFSPARWPGLTLGVTGFDVTFKNRIGTPVQQNISRALSDPTLTSFVTRINPLANAADLAKITALLANPAVTTLNGVFPPTAFGAIADNRYVNTTTLEVSGLDLTGGYRFERGKDAFVLGANATYLFRYDQQVTPTSPVVDDVNVANFPVRFRGRLTADWTRGRVTTGLAFNYVGAYHDALGARIGDQPTVDVQLHLAPPDHGVMRGIATLLNVRNLFDKDPPFYNNPVGIGYDAANADPIGRYVSIQLIRRW